MIDKIAEIGVFNIRTWHHSTCFESSAAACRDKELTVEIMKIIGNVSYDLLIAAGIITMVVMVSGGIMYIVSSGSPDKVAKAHKTISGGLIGALISVSASQIVGFIMSQASDNTETTLSNIMSTLYYLVGALSLVMIIFGGLSYILANGSEDKVKKAKKNIIWACVGLAVAIGAWTITEFVLTKVAP